MKVKEFLQENGINQDVMLALIDHFHFSTRTINSYSELSEEEKNFISEDTWNKLINKK